MTYHVYMLRCSNGDLYTGCTNNLDRRLAQHNKGVASKFTRSRLPVVLVWHEEQGGRGAALRREMQIKKLSRTQKLEMIANSLSARPS